MTPPIYMDYHSTTPVDPRVLKSMLPYFTDNFGNASSLDHSFGYDASISVESARDKIAQLIGCKKNDIIFTSGATESNNLAIMGVMQRYSDRGNHMITTSTEHKAILEIIPQLKELNKKITILPVDKYGQIDVKELKNAITKDTILISIIAANNEIGTINDLEVIGKIAHENEILFHTDAAQAVGHIPIDVEKMNIDLMSFSAHKMYGPKGIGALYIRGIKPRVKLTPIIRGGGQERNIRSGTLNVPGIVGFGKAAELAKKEMSVANKQYSEGIGIMLKSFEKLGAKLNGHPTNRLPQNLNVYFPNIESKAILNLISKQISISAGSACTTQSVEPSHVLLATGLSIDNAHSSIRFGLGRFNTPDDIQIAIHVVINAVSILSKITTDQVIG